MSNQIIILVIVILLCSILGGVVYWKRADIFGTGEDDDAAAEKAAAEKAAAEAAAAEALGKSCSVEQDCISPLVCDEYSMTCGHAPIVPVVPTCNTTACNDFMRDLVVNKNKSFITDEVAGV